MEELIDVVCVLPYTLPNANRPLVLPGTSSLRVSKSSCTRIPPMGRVPSSAITLIFCLSARPHTKIAVTHRTC